MRIEPNLTRLDGSQPAGPQPAPDASGPPSAPPAGPAQGPLYTRAPELLQLLNRLGSYPAVRPDVLERVSERLAAGDYLSPAAADATAAAIRGGPGL